MKYKYNQAVKLKKCPERTISGETYIGFDFGYIIDPIYKEKCWNIHNGEYIIIVAALNKHHSFIPIGLNDCDIEYAYPDGSKFEYRYGFGGLRDTVEVVNGLLNTNDKHFSTIHIARLIKVINDTSLYKNCDALQNKDYNISLDDIFDCLGE